MPGYLAQAAGDGADRSGAARRGPPLAAYACAALAATSRDGHPSGAGRPDPVARPDAGGADGRERRRGLDRECEPPCRTCARRPPARALERGGCSRSWRWWRSLLLCSSLRFAGRRRPGVAVRHRRHGRGGSAVAHEPGLRALIWLLGLQAMAIGVLDVLYVVLAVAVLGHGGETAGYLNAAFGAGGVLGVVATVALVGRTPARLASRRRARAVGRGPGRHRRRLFDTGALVLLAAAGAGRTVLDVAGRTLLQRLAQPEALGRVFGLLESVSMAGLAVGSVIAPVFVALAGGSGAFVCLALLLPSHAARVPELLAADARRCCRWSRWRASGRCRSSRRSRPGRAGDARARARSSRSRSRRAVDHPGR